MKISIEKTWVPDGDKLFANKAAIESLKQRLLAMGTIAQKLVNQALQALIQRDPNLALRVRQRDRTLDRCEIEIDDLLIQQLSRKPPADVLRLVTVSMKISHNLERIGDEASKIARQALALCQDQPLKADPDVPHMAIFSLNLLEAALSAFDEHDGAAAFALISRDKEADALNKSVCQKLFEYMVSKPEMTKPCLRWMVISKSLERIAGHAANIAEDVVFLCEGRDLEGTELEQGASSCPANN